MSKEDSETLLKDERLLNPFKEFYLFKNGVYSCPFYKIPQVFKMSSMPLFSFIDDFFS